jgi:hypothetical protein
MSRRSIYPSSANCMVRRDRPDVDQPCRHCGGRIATLGASTAVHAAAMICTCGRFTTWLSDRTTDGTLCDAAIGEPQPISLHAIEQVIQMAKNAHDTVENDNRGKLYKNEDRKSDKSPEYSGPSIINGIEMNVAGWVNETKNGKKFMALRYSPKIKPATMASSN